MARGTRAALPGRPLHVVQRGINRETCFLSDADFAAYLRFLATFAAKFGCAVHAYCLMTNHVHLLLTPPASDACALLMKNLSQCYVQWLNHRLGRSGTVWEGRFQSCMLNTEAYVLTCYQYIELNPVRAGMVDAPERYRWSSHAANAHGDTDGMVTAHEAYDALGGPGAYRQLCRDAPSQKLVDEIRSATRIGCIAGQVRRRRGRPIGLK